VPEVLILTGPPGAGKTTVARALAERYDRVAHVNVDQLGDFITPTGQVRPWGPKDAWARQEALLDRCACDVSLQFLAERFAVIIDWVIIQPEHLAKYVELLQPAGMPVHYIRLLPSLEACLARNVERDKESRLYPARIETVHAMFAAAGYVGGATVDSTTMSAYETADRLQALTTSGQSLVWRPEGAS
jgi:predicted kinase